MKRLLLTAVLLFLTGSCFAKNIAYKNDTGQIMELDEADVTRFVNLNDPNISTGTITDDKIVCENIAPLNKVFFNQATQKVECKNTDELSQIELEKNVQMIVETKKNIVILQLLATTEKDQDVLDQINIQLIVETKNSDDLTIIKNQIKSKINKPAK